MVRAGPGSLTPRKKVSGALSYVNSMCNSAIQVTWEVLYLFIPLEISNNSTYSQVNLRNKNYLSICLQLVCSFQYLSTKKKGWKLLLVIKYLIRAIVAGGEMGFQKKKPS